MVLCESIYGYDVSVPRETMVFRPSVYGVVLLEDRLLVVTSRGPGRSASPAGAWNSASRSRTLCGERCVRRPE
jgi:hypothetical protein